MFFNKIKQFVNHNLVSIILVVAALIVLLLGVRYEIVTQEYEAKIVILKQANVALSSRITDTEATNENLQKLVKFYKDQVIDKSKKVRDIKSYISKNYRTISPETASLIADQIVTSGEKHGVPVTAIVAVMEVESHFDSKAVSSVGARGLMQVMPRIWAKEFKLENKYALHGIEVGIESGVKVLKRYLNKTDNNMEKTLFKYVGGSTDYVRLVYKSMAKFVIHSTTIDIMEKEAKAAAKAAKVIPTVVVEPKVTEELPEVD